jgi:hypothetical protein
MGRELVGPSTAIPLTLRVRDMGVVFPSLNSLPALLFLFQLLYTYRIAS